MKSRWLAYALALVAPTALGVGCKGGGSSISFLEIVETAPLEGQTEVPVETRIGFRVNAPIDPDTLGTDTVFLTDDEGALVPSTVAVGDEPDVAELMPDAPLDVITTFTVTVTTGLAAQGGATLEQDYTWKFTTLDSAWGTSQWLEQIGTGVSDQHQIAVDGQSNALAVWQYTEPEGSRVWANRYTRADTWGTPEPISNGVNLASNPRLAADGAGNGFAVWEEMLDLNLVNIYTSRYVVDQGWEDPSLLQSGEVTNARSPSVAADPTGNAIAVWVQRATTGADQVIWASRYEPGAGWDTAAPIDSSPTATAGEKVSIGMDADGNAIAVWARPSVPTAGGFSEVLWANRYVAGVGWGTAERIKPDSETRARDERLAVGPNGDAFVIWVQNDPMRLCAKSPTTDAPCDDIWAIRFSGSSWGTPERIDDYDDDFKNEPDIAVDGTGMAYAVWSQDDPDFKNIWAVEYTPGPGWGTPELIEPANADPNEDGDATTPRVGVNAAGNVFVVWRQIWDSWGSIWSNRHDPGEAWVKENAELIEDIERAAKLPKIAVDENRHAHAVWLHNNAGADWVRTNRFE
ncbi:MAG: Ig-like domain-containing protein [Polyangiales bacterium]